MPHRCVVGGCSNIKDISRNISLHKFPSDVQLRRTWEKQVQKTRAKWTATDSSEICSTHFTEDSFERTPQLMAQYGLEVRRKRALKKNAIPTIFPTTSGTASVGNKTPPVKQLKLSRGAFDKREKARVGVHIMMYQTYCHHSIGFT